MTVSLEFRLPAYAAVGARSCVWRPVAANLALVGYGGAVRLADPPELAEERKTPAMLWWPQRITIDEVVETPRGYEPRLAQSEWRAGAAEQFASCDLTATAKDRKVTHAGSFRFARRQVSLADWPSFRAAVNTWRDAGAAHLVARREGK